MNFELTLKEEKVNPRQSTGLHLLVALAIIMSGAIAFFLYHLFFRGSQLGETKELYLLKWAGIGIILIGFALLYLIIFKNKWLLKKKISAAFRVFELLAMLFFTGFALLEKIKIPAFTYGILSVAVLLAMFWENGNNVQKVKVTEDGIKLPLSSANKLLAWVDIEKVLLRYGTLTIDCVNNKLLQWNVDPSEINAEVFEAYCDDKIEANRSKRIEDW